MSKVRIAVIPQLAKNLNVPLMEIERFSQLETLYLHKRLVAEDS